MRPPEHSPRDLTDRVFRKTLENVDNLREFLEEALPEHVAFLDCTHARLLPREFVANDWRGREADLLYEVPYQTPEGSGRALVCVLIEHQSRTDVLMPFRTLFLTVAFWDRQWRDWEQGPVPRPEFRFTPVIPIVLYTGPTPWGSTRRLTELLGEPAAFHAFAPECEPLFWNLAEHTPDELLNKGEGWRNLLAVIRQELADETDFRRVYREAIRRLDALHASNRPRWQELLEALLTWSYAKRPQAEHAALQADAEAVLSDPVEKQEIRTMSQKTVEYLYERAYLEGHAKARAEALVEGELLHARKTLRQQLTQRFGPLPAEVNQRIDDAADLEKLDSCLSKVLTIHSLEDLSL